MVHFILKFKKILFWKKIHFGLVFVLTPTKWTSDCLLKVLFKCFNGRQIWIFGAKETCNPQDCSHSVFASACEFSTLLSHSVLMMAHLNILTMFQTTGKIVYFSNKNGLTWQWQHCHKQMAGFQKGFSVWLVQVTSGILIHRPFPWAAKKCFSKIWYTSTPTYWIKKKVWIRINAWSK